VGLSSLPIFDNLSDKYLILDKIKTKDLNNTIETTGSLKLAESLGGTKGLVGESAEVIGGAIIAVAPGVSGPFIQLA